MDQKNIVSVSKTERIAFVKGSWHAGIVDKAEEGFLTELEKLGWSSDQVDVFAVPGAYDIPLLVKKLAQSGRYSALVGSAFVVDGGIYRHDFVAGTVVDALMQVQLEVGVPVLSAVLTPHQFQETEAHEAFFRDHFVLKGQEAARAAISLIETFASLPAAVPGEKAA